MYLSVTMIILGEALLAHSVALAGYWAVWFVCANLFVIVYEEPALRRAFGDEYEAYFQGVSRWLPRRSKKEKLRRKKESGCNGCEATARLSNQEVRKNF